MVLTTIIRANTSLILHAAPATGEIETLIVTQSRAHLRKVVPMIDDALSRTHITIP